MKLAISNIAWKPFEAEKVYSIMKTNGLYHLEVAPSLIVNSPQPNKVPVSKIIEVKKNLEMNHGLSVISMQSLLFGQKDLFLFRDSESRKRLINHMKCTIDFAHNIGARNLVFGSPKNRWIEGLSEEESTKIAVSFFQKIAELAKSKKCVISIEANPTIYNCNFITENNQAIELIKKVDHPNFRLNYDLGTVIINKENYTDFIEQNINFISHVHVSAPQLEAVPGGFIKVYERAISLLKELNYQHGVSVEMRTTSEEDNLIPVTTAIRFLSGLIK